MGTRNRIKPPTVSSRAVAFDGHYYYVCMVLAWQSWQEPSSGRSSHISHNCRCRHSSSSPTTSLFFLPLQPLRVLFRINWKAYLHNRVRGAMTLWLAGYGANSDCSLSQPQLPTEHFPLINLNRLLSRRHCLSPTSSSCAAETALKRCHYKFIGTWEHTHLEYYERVIIFNCRWCYGYTFILVQL